MSFGDYARHGWVLVPIPAGTKGPTHRRWNQRDYCVDDPATADALESAGLAHAYSGTCEVDIDDLEAATDWLAERGIDLPALLAADDAVRIYSGREGRAKLLYAVSEPLRTVTPCPALELRCATKEGRTVQCVLPPSVHPETGQPYEWRYPNELVGDWRQLPPLPDALLELWQGLTAPRERDAAPPDDADTAELERMLAAMDPDCAYDEWIRLGMALHHATAGSQAGLEVWDRWSAGGSKYGGYRDLAYHWASFEVSDGVTVDYLRMSQVASADDFEPVEAEAPVSEDSRFRFEAARDWADRPPPRWIVDQVLPESDLAMIFGESGAGKSFLALDLAIAIARGEPWRGEPWRGEAEVQRGPVAWIAAEAAGSMRNRLRAAAQGQGFDLATLDLWITGETPNLTDLEQVRALAKAAKAVNPSVIFVDTLAAASGGANENSGEDMNVVLAACRALHKITGALVVLIHHSGKDRAKGSRGWSGIKAAMQTEIEVTNDHGGLRMARMAKQRDAEDGGRYAFNLTPVTLWVGESEVTTACFVSPAAMPEREKADRPAATAATHVISSFAPGTARLALADVREAAVEAMDVKRGSRDMRTAQVDRAALRLVHRGELTAQGLELGVPAPKEGEF